MTAHLEKQFDSLKKKCDDLYEETLDAVALDGKPIKVALKEQLTLQVEWEILCAQVNKIRNLSEDNKEDLYSKAIGKYINHSHRTYSITEAKELAKSDPDFRQARVFHIEVQELYDEVKGMLETVQSRKYILNNFSNLIVATSENVIL